MKIAIIGGGITGLTAAYYLSKKGHSVTIFEKEPYLGGLAFGFRKPEWNWHLESTYHHCFTNDTAIISLIKELGLADTLIIKRPITANLVDGTIAPLDSPLSLFLFPKLSFLDKIRTAFLIGILKCTPFWRLFESITAEQLITSIGGTRAYNTIWKPLLYGKFGDLAPTVSSAWFWARIKKRTPSLIYIRGGFHTFISALETAIKKQSGEIFVSKHITKIPKGFDKILLTIPTSVAIKLFPKSKPPPSIPHLFAQTLILETKKPILDRVYWLNITDSSFPFLAAVAHTNFMDPAHYNGHHITYFGNYLPTGHPYLSLTKQRLLKKFLPYIQRISQNTTSNILHTHLFTVPFAQPVHQLHYSMIAPRYDALGLPNVYLANMDSIYPWDRGTNYAVELGQNIAKTIYENS